MVYIVYHPGDDIDTLSWVSVCGTKREAMAKAEDFARYHTTLNRRWMVVYRSAKEQAESFATPNHYSGSQIIFVEQAEEYSNAV